MSTAAVPQSALEVNLPEELFEVVNGQRREVPPMGAFAGLLASELVGFLRDFAKQHKLGLAVAEVLFTLRQQPLLRRKPDVAFVSYDRLPDPVLPAKDPAAWDVVPKLAVEFVSPTDFADEIIDRLRDYFDSGVQLAWVFYPRHRYVYVYESLTGIRVLTERDELDGAVALPGFRLRVGELFAPLVKP
jgi:Uma2 family endonuclease